MTVVILTAIVPTLIAQAAFPPTQDVLEAESGGREEVEVAQRQVGPSGRPFSKE